MSIVSEIERKVCAMPKQFRDWFAEFYHATCSGEGRQMTDEEVETSVSTWQAATSSADAEWRGVVEKLVTAGDELSTKCAKYRHAHDAYGDGHKSTGRAWDEMRRADECMRDALAQAEKLIGRKL